MKSKDLRKKLLEVDEAFRDEYLKRDFPLEIAHLVVAERIKKGLTQKQLASLAGTRQSDISRIESGVIEPGFDKLNRIVVALGKSLDLHRMLGNQDNRTTDNFADSTTGVEDPYISQIWSPFHAKDSKSQMQEVKISSNL